MPKPTPWYRAPTLPQRLRLLREFRGLTQQQVADHLGFRHRVQVSELERDGGRHLRALEANRVCELLKVRVSVLLKGL